MLLIGSIILYRSEGAFFATEESRNFVGETLRYRSHRPDVLREGDNFEMIYINDKKSTSLHSEGQRARP